MRTPFFFQLALYFAGELAIPYTCMAIRLTLCETESTHTLQSVLCIKLHLFSLYFVSPSQGKRGPPGIPGLPGSKGHKVNIFSFFTIMGLNMMRENNHEIRNV